MNLLNFDHMDENPPLRTEKNRQDFGRTDLGSLLFILNLSKLSNQGHPDRKRRGLIRYDKLFFIENNTWVL